MSTERPVPLDRVYLLNPGQSLHVGDRTLHVSARRCSTARPRSGSTTTNRGRRSAPTASARPSPAPNWPQVRTSVKSPPGTCGRRNYCGPRSIAPGSTTPTPTRTSRRSGPCARPHRTSSSAPTCRPLTGSVRSSSTCWPRHPAPTRSSARPGGSRPHASQLRIHGSPRRCRRRMTKGRRDRGPARRHRRRGSLPATMGAAELKSGCNAPVT